MELTFCGCQLHTFAQWCGVCSLQQGDCVDIKAICVITWVFINSCCLGLLIVVYWLQCFLSGTWSVWVVWASSWWSNLSTHNLHYFLSGIFLNSNKTCWCWQHQFFQWIVYKLQEQAERNISDEVNNGKTPKLWKANGRKLDNTAPGYFL